MMMKASRWYRRLVRKVEKASQSKSKRPSETKKPKDADSALVQKDASCPIVGVLFDEEDVPVDEVQQSAKVNEKWQQGVALPTSPKHERKQQAATMPTSPKREQKQQAVAAPVSPKREQSTSAEDILAERKQRQQAAAVPTSPKREEKPQVPAAPKSPKKEAISSPPRSPSRKLRRIQAIASPSQNTTWAEQNAAANAAAAAAAKTATSSTKYPRRRLSIDAKCSL